MRRAIVLVALVLLAGVGVAHAQTTSTTTSSSTTTSTTAATTTTTVPFDQQPQCTPTTPQGQVCRGSDHADTPQSPPAKAVVGNVSLTG